jgi:predicted negative regulator of RcsB-dependent stress response
MDNYETEEQQVEAIKKWLNENYKMLIAVSIIGLGSIFGIQQWKNNKLMNAEVASLEYDQILNSVNKSPASTESDNTTIADISTGVATLQTEYSQYPYAALATLVEAKELMSAGDFSAAETKYLWVIDNSSLVSLQHISRIRVATLLSSQGKNEEALKALGTEFGSFKASYMETQGDILVLLKRTNEAKAAYDQALDAYAAIGANTQVLTIKRNDLGKS